MTLSPGAPGRDPLALVEQAAISEEILSAVRHSLNNRFSTVRNAAFYVRRRLSGSEAGAEDPRVDQFLRTIDEEIVAAHALLNEGSAARYLVERRAGPTRAEPCIDRAVELARIADPGVRIDVETAAAEVDADPGELALAVRCLVENAAEAMPGGGAVTIRALLAGAELVIEVVDEGPGIPEDAREAVLGAFYTTKPGHAGLGLCIAGRVARRARGALLIRDRPAGTAVALSLPLAGAPIPALRCPPQPP